MVYVALMTESGFISTSPHSARGYACQVTNNLFDLNFQLWLPCTTQFLPASPATGNSPNSPAVGDTGKGDDATNSLGSPNTMTGTVGLPSEGKTSILALSAIPVVVKHEEKQPSSASSPLHTLPTVSLHYRYFQLFQDNQLVINDR